jgi:hypothetical protein
MLTYYSTFKLGLLRQQPFQGALMTGYLKPPNAIPFSPVLLTGQKIVAYLKNKIKT